MAILGTGCIAFDGLSDYLKIPYSSLFELGANYTVDFRVNFTNLTHDAELFGFGNTGYGIIIRWNESSSGKIKVYHGSGSWTSFESSANPFTANTWHHVAVVNNAGSQTIYVDGVSVGTGSLGTPTYTLTNDLYIGCEYLPDTDDFNLNGFLDEYRVSDTARWTSGFTPPASAYTTDSNTLLLLHGDGSHGSTAIYDSASNSSAVQPVFGTGFGVFIHEDSQLRFADSSDWAFGTADFTIDFRIMMTETPTGNDRIFATTVWTNNGGFLITTSTSRTIRFYDGNTDALELESDSALDLHTWYHIAIVNNSGTMTMYVNGTAQALTHTGTNYSNKQLSIGTKLTAGTESFQGYLDEVRISNNARWTTGFTVPTSAYSDDANTLALLHMDGSTGDTTFTNSGTAMSFPKFGTGAGYFNDSTSKLEISDHADWDFGNGDFTIDVWISPSALGTYETIVSNRLSASDQSFAIYTKGTTQLRFGYSYNGSTWYDFDFTLPTSLQLNTWQHIAVVRDSTTIYAYLDGVQCSNSITVGTNSLYNGTGNLTIGLDPRFTLAFGGYMDELRISKGTAEWTTGFTPPSSEYADSTYELTLHMNGTQDSTTFTDSGVTGHTVTPTDAVIKTQDPTVNGNAYIIEEGHPIIVGGDTYIADGDPRLNVTSTGVNVDIALPPPELWVTATGLNVDIHIPQPISGVSFPTVYTTTATVLICDFIGTITAESGTVEDSITYVAHNYDPDDFIVNTTQNYTSRRILSTTTDTLVVSSVSGQTVSDSIRIYQFVDHTCQLKQNSLNVNKKIEEDTEARFSLITDGTYTPRVGQYAKVFMNSVHVFTGFIKNVRRYLPINGVDQRVFFDVDCTTLNNIPPRRTIAIAYDSGTTSSDIVESVVNTFLVDEGVTSGTIEQGVILYDDWYDDALSISDVLDSLAEKSGYQWFIDKSFNLQYYQDPTTISAYSQTITDISPSFTDFRNVTINETVDNYSNKAFYVGNTDDYGNIMIISQETTASIIEVQDYAGGSGVYGTVVRDSNMTEHKFFECTASTSETVIVSTGIDANVDVGDLIMNVDRYERRNVTAVASDSITLASAISGQTQGDVIATYKEINDVVDNRLKRSDVVQRTLEFDTFTTDFEPAQTLQVALSKLSAETTDTYVIESVDIADRGAGYYVAHVMATKRNASDVSTQRTPTYKDYFREF